MSQVFNVPIALIVFNRPELTAQVFECIRAARPRQLFVIADGPRHPEERDLCERTRAIATSIDWECDVQTNFSEANLGCGKRIASGLTWVFEHCEEAIILEDDCVADPTFFPYCAELLDKYRDDEKIAMISGTNYLQGYSDPNTVPDSYYFSRFSLICGWATWRRAWKNFDFEMKEWPALKSIGWLEKTYGHNPVTKLRRRNFDRVYLGVPDIWDTQWQFSVLRHNSLVILPTANLICNIGFVESATHTKVPNCQANLETFPMIFPLKHPASFAPDEGRDNYTFKKIFLPTLKKRSILQRVKTRASLIASRSIRLFSGK